MRIALVSPYAVDVPGGVTGHVANLARELRCQGHEVTRLAPASRGAILEPDVVAIGRPIPIPASGSIARVTLSLRLAGPVKASLERGAFDVVHLHEPLTPALPLYFLSASRALTVGTFHAAYEGGNRRYAFARWPLRHYARRLHGRIAVSSAAEQLAARYFPGVYTVIPNGVDARRFGKCRSVPPGLGPERGPYILFVGRLEPRKGLSTLLEAWAWLQGQFPQLRLVVVGEGRKRERYVEWARRHGLQRVTFVGQVPAGDLPAYYQHALVFSAPNTGNESFGVVLLEAMAAGAPIVASDISGFREVLEGGRHGLLVPPGRPRELATAIARLATDAALSRHLREAGRRRAREFSWDAVAQQVSAFYEGLLEARSVPERYGV